MHRLANQTVTLNTGLPSHWNLQSMKSDTDRIFGFLDPDVALSLATVPVLVALIGGNAIAQSLQELGTMSEEIFRGDRLPRLDFPPDQS